MKLPITALLTMGAIVAFATVASAAAVDIRVDFNGTAADPAGNWNVMEAPGAQTNLVDFGTGLGSGVDVAVAGDWKDSTASTEWNTSNPGPAWDAAADSGMDYFWLGGNTGDEVGTTTFSGLTPGQAYRVELIASSDSTTNGDAEYTVNGAFFDGSADGLYNFLDGYNEGSWLVWSSVAADANGELVIQVDQVNEDGRGRINGVQVTEVPEPATLVLVGLGALGLLRRRRA